MICLREMASSFGGLGKWFRELFPESDFLTYNISEIFRSEFSEQNHYCQFDSAFRSQKERSFRAILTRRVPGSTRDKYVGKKHPLLHRKEGMFPKLTALFSTHGATNNMVRNRSHLSHWLKNLGYEIRVTVLLPDHRKRQTSGFTFSLRT